MGDKITLYVSLTGKPAAAQVVFADREQSRHFGVELAPGEHLRHRASTGGRGNSFRRDVDGERSVAATTVGVPLWPTVPIRIHD